MAIETLYASGLVSATTPPSNASATLGAPNSTWTQDGNTNVSWDQRWSLDDPAGDTSSDTAATLTVRLRKGSNSKDPTLVSWAVFADGAQIASGTPNTVISNTGGSDFQLSAAIDLSGVSDLTTLEVSVTTLGQGGSGTARNSVEMDALTFTADITTGGGEPESHSGTGSITGTGSMSGVGDNPSGGGGGYLLEEHFEGASPGSTITSTNTIFDPATPAGTIETGGVSGQCAQNVFGTTAETWLLGTTVTPVNDTYFWRFYHYWSVDAGANKTIAQPMDASNGILAQIQRQASGAFRLRNVQTEVDASAGPLPHGEFVRFDWFIDAGAGTQTVEVFVGANLQGSTPDYTLSGAYTGATALAKLRVGAIQSVANMTVKVDEWSFSDTAFPTIGGGGEEHSGTGSMSGTTSISSTGVKHGVSTDGTGSDPVLYATLPPDLPDGVWPSPFNTGVDPRISLTEHSGNYSTSADNEVVEFLDISGDLLINHANVKIRHCRVWGEVEEQNDSASFEIWNCTVGTPTGISRGRAIGNKNYTAKRCNVFGTLDGFKAEGNVLIRDCYAHDLWRTYDESQQGFSHNDLVQSNQGVDIQIIHNTFYAWSFGDGGFAGQYTGQTPYSEDGYMTSALMINNGVGDIDNVLIDKNLFRGWAAKYVHTLDNTNGLYDITNVTVSNNFYGTEFRDYPNWHANSGGATAINNTEVSDDPMALITDGQWESTGEGGTPAEITAIASMSAIGGNFLTGTGSISATSSITSSGTRKSAGTATIVATGSVSGTGQQLSTGSGVITASGSMQSVGLKEGSGLGLTISSTTGISSTGSRESAGTGSVSATSSISGAGDKVESGTGAGTITATGALGSSGSRTSRGTATASASSSITGTGQKVRQATGSISGTTAISSTGTRVSLGSGVASGSSSVSSSGVKKGAGTATPLSAATGISSTGERTSLGAVFIIGASSLALNIDERTSLGTGSIAGTGSLSSTGFKVLPVLFTEEFEDGSLGANVGPTNSVFELVLNDAATFVESPITGELAGLFDATGNYIRVKHEFAAGAGVTKTFLRTCFVFEAYPSGVMRFLAIETSPDAEPPGEDVAVLRMEASGRVRVFNGSGFVTGNQTVDPIPLDTLVRAELDWDDSAGSFGQAELRLYIGANFWGTTPDETVTVPYVARPHSTPATTLNLGVLNQVTARFVADAIALGTSEPIGPTEYATGTGSMSATGSTSATGERRSVGDGAISATGSLSGDGGQLETLSGAGAIAATGSVDATGVRMSSGTGSVTATGSLSGEGREPESQSGTGIVAGASSISSTGVRTSLGSGQPVSGSASASTTGERTSNGTGSISGFASTDGTGQPLEEGAGTGSLGGSTDITSTGLKRGRGSSTASTSSSIASTGSKKGRGVAAATGLLTGTAQGFTARVGDGELDGTGVATWQGVKHGAGTASATGALSVTGEGLDPRHIGVIVPSPSTVFLAATTSLDYARATTGLDYANEEATLEHL